MAVKLYFLATCALLISTAASAPAIDKVKLQHEAHNRGMMLCQNEAYTKFSASRFVVGDYIKIECTAQPSLELEKHVITLGEKPLETKSEGGNVITALVRITAEDRSKFLVCEALTAPNPPEKQATPDLKLTYKFLN